MLNTMMEDKNTSFSKSLVFIPEAYICKRTLSMLLPNIFKYINFGNQFHYGKYNQKLHHAEYYNGKNENTSSANISIPFLISCS